jgi:hypothetical protein
MKPKDTVEEPRFSAAKVLKRGALALGFLPRVMTMV